MNTNNLYYAHELAAIIGNGITSNRVGRIANKNNLKTEEYGMYFQEEANNQAFYVSVFKYNEKAIRPISDIWNKLKK